MSSNFPELVFTDDEDFDATRLNQAMQVLDSRLRALEPFTPTWQAAVDDLRLVGLQRLNEAILPSYQRIQELSSLGFLVAESSTSLTLVENENVTFIINDGVKRALFTPTPFIVITRESVATDYAVAKKVSYDPTTGELLVTIKTVTGNPGPFTDWWVGALAGNALAAQQYFATIDAARAIVVAARDLVVSRAAQSAIDAATATAAKNAAVTAASNAALWDPTSYSTTAQMDAAIAAAVANLINGAPGALDQINELATALGNDANFAATITNALANRLRFDSAQSLTGPQKAQAISNLGLILGSAAAKNVGTSAGELVELQAGGKLPAVDGSLLTGLSSAGLLVAVDLYTTSQTITIKGTTAIIEMVGPGGGGGSNHQNSGNPAAAPGGAGAYLYKRLTGLTINNTFVYTQGGVGVGKIVAGSSAAGTDGGTSTLASGTQTIGTLTCPGGRAGQPFSNYMAASAAPTGGDINLPAPSYFYMALDGAPDGNQQRGGTPFGDFGVGGEPPAAAMGSPGNLGIGYGSGPGAARAMNVSGRDGQPGAMRIYWFK